MPDLRDTRRKVQIVLAAMAIVDVIALGVFFSPLVGSQASRREQLDQAWRELQQKTREVEPLRGLDKKIPIARKEIADFYAQRLPLYRRADLTVSTAGRTADENARELADRLLSGD